ncbi:ankyrin repeat protein [Ectocarpus siliculosus]|uniref:Ankyrin repeat protein n=1 Tax=Ectocarpus siliculosus TaxID=2880 RepID=D7G6J7_ECTSI|nr:ankyrin repeat protein [Ectocarpus siliculosus]|eukprot:CBJ27582.1 ankyrin repeat protein [Ectocarpus siliculosus]
MGSFRCRRGQASTSWRAQCEEGALRSCLLSLRLTASSRRRGDRSMVGTLIKVGVPLECRPRLGNPPLATAVASDGALGIARDLLDAGADVNKSNAGYGVLPYMEDMMDLLPAAGADLGKERAATSPLHAAAQCDCCGAIQRLISAGASVHQLNSGGRSALHMACLHKCEGAVKLLLRYNTCMTLLCDKGLSPFDVVAIAVLNRRENYGFYPQGYSPSGRSPSTSNADETYVADHIHDLLRRTSGWRRRGCRPGGVSREDSVLGGAQFS